MDIQAIIRKYYDPRSKAYDILMEHSRMVTRKALQIAERITRPGADVAFIEEAAMLHDIGIFLTDSPEIGCHGLYPYVCHGYLGRELIEREGLYLHALVCERHVGMGITAADIERNRLPLPVRDMVPMSLEEKIICIADKFFSKDRENRVVEKPIPVVREQLRRYGEEKVRQFDELLALFDRRC